MLSIHLFPSCVKAEAGTSTEMSSAGPCKPKAEDPLNSTKPQVRLGTGITYVMHSHNMCWIIEMYKSGIGKTDSFIIFNLWWCIYVKMLISLHRIRKVICYTEHACLGTTQRSEYWCVICTIVTFCLFRVFNCVFYTSFVSYRLLRERRLKK